MDYYSLFWGLRVIGTINDPRVRLPVGHQHSQFWPVLARFMDYYSQFWGPVVISTINELRDAFTCRSLTLTVSADSGPFRGLLLTVLGAGVISTINQPRVRICVGHQCSQFWPILAHFVDYYSLFWVPE